jgi:hypothetical protein
LLDRAAKFHGEISSVVDGDRFIYIAGYDRQTPCRLKIESPGDFTYQYSLDGDGRVPHDLGILNNVRTYWVDEDHGSLAKNEDVLDSIHGLLTEGVTDVLTNIKPTSRKVPQTNFIHPESMEEIPYFFNEICESEKLRKGSKGLNIDWQRQTVLENAITSDYLGETQERMADAYMVEKPNKIRKYKSQKLKIEVEWGDITEAKGDVYCVGHYQDVLPQDAEKALDEKISNSKNAHRQILRQHTLRAVIRGELGDINFYPKFLSLVNLKGFI